MTDEPFSDQLEAWLASDSPKTVGDLGTVFAEKSFAVTILFLMFVPALPLPTGGITHVFELITILLSAELVLGARSIWLPARWRDRELGPATTGKAIPFMMRRIRWLERFSRPRAASLFDRRWFLRILGLVFIGLAASAALAPPFSGLDTLPALGAVFVALAIIMEDVVALGIGLGIGAGGVVLILTVGVALVNLIRGFFF
ncbi:MAG TPA: exopolysaccharide biosynthesis protein [Acidimicrobiales bacterium]|nr:exopolysaccharide biosynthesis protein [Acidimicrobiales bacterium]